MKKLMVALLATSVMTVGLPALAHEHPPESAVQGGDWNYDIDNYDEFNQEYQHIWQNIEHGVNDGSYTPWQARRYFREMQQIKARADWMQRKGYYDPQDIQQRLDSLHDRMHLAHERGHERQDRYGDYDYPR